MKKKLTLVTKTHKDVEQYAFYCPGCEMDHAIWVKNKEGGLTWKWNGDVEKPTVSPSIKIEGFNGRTQKHFLCHFYVKAGKIEYLNDCTHPLAGKTVEMEDIE